jgi:parallel beta-helix repeat protein
MIGAAVVCVLLAGGRPAPTVLDAARLQAAILKAYGQGKRSYTIAPGTYAVPKAAADFFLNFSGLKEFTIEAQGVTLILQDPTKGCFHFTGCSHVTLDGITMWHDPVPFTQATIRAFDPKGAWYDVDVMSGYPDWLSNPNVLPQNSVGYVFDQETRQWKAGTIDVYFSSVTPLGAHRFRLNVSNPYPQPAKVGDFMTFRGNVESDIQLDQCERMDVSGVTIESSPGFVVHESDGNGRNHYSFTVTYGPAPTGASERPLVSSNADAFHSNAARVGPTVENCLFQGMPDDGTNIHGNYADVAQSLGTTLYVDTLWGDLPVRPGDPLLFYSSTDVPLGVSATVQSAQPVPNYVPPKPSSLPAFANVHQFWQIVVDRPLNLSPDDLVGMPMAEGDGFVYRNNTIRNNRARGILIKASDGLVEGNAINGSTIAGIVISPELGGGMESDFSHKLVVRDNSVRHVAYQNIGPWINQAGAISLTCDPGGGIGHDTVTFEGNTVEYQDGINLLVTNARNVTIRGNRFLHPMQHATDRGSTYGFDPNALIDLENDRGIALDSNEIVDPGPAMKTTLHVGVNVTGVTRG